MSFQPLRNFAAIDFETANQHRGSVCSVGIVVVRAGCVTEKFYELIRPTPDFYSAWNTRIHGLSAADTASADPFAAVWDRVAPHIAGLPLVAHNSPFDEGCLRTAHLESGLPYPAYQFLCTLRMARRALPSLPNHRLPTVAAHIGFDLQHHHDALADAEACACIALSIGAM